MDIYQIWTTYNPMWSEREIICFSMLMILVMVVVAYGIWKEKWNPVQGASIIVLVLFLGIVFGSTVFTRITVIRQYELKPFWSWCAVIRYHDRELLKENLLNCLLLVPMGLLLPIIFNHKVKLIIPELSESSGIISQDIRCDLQYRRDSKGQQSETVRVL